MNLINNYKDPSEKSRVRQINLTILMKLKLQVSLNLFNFCSRLVLDKVAINLLLRKSLYIDK